MAEELDGSFTITALSNNDELYFVKGNNPICIYHYEDLGFYLYASTEAILKKALKRLPYPMGCHQQIFMCSGEILKIDAKGKMTRSHFDDSKLYTARWSNPWPDWPQYEPVSRPYVDNSGYLDDLKSIAVFYGLFPEDIDALLEDGMTTDEIEEFLYCG